MILYLDTSSMVKLYVDEEGAEHVRRQVEDADVVATSVVAFAEARSAFARLNREEALSGADLARVREAFLADWASFLKVRVPRRVYEHAGRLTEEHSLRGFDALHLASYLEIVSRSENEPVEFSAFDARLTEAAGDAAPD